MTRKGIIHSFLLSLLFLLASSIADAQTVIRVLSIGNSFSEDAVEQNLYELAHEAGYELIIGNAYRGGQSLKSHWNVVSTNNPDFEYRKVVNGKRTNRTKVLLKDIVTDEPWDIVTFQQVSQDAGIYSTYVPYLQNLIDYVKSIATAKHVRYGFHQTWAYAKNSTHKQFKNYGFDQMRMYNDICATTQKALANHPDLSFVVPSCTAIQNARTSGLGDYMNRDGYHLDYDIGRYTAACAWLETITGASPTDVSWRPKKVTADEAYLARRSAHDAVAHPFSITQEPQGIDTLRISMFGSSVAFGTGATDNHGYAWLYNHQLNDRARWHHSQYPFHISNISIGGNTTKHLLGRYKDLIHDLGKYVIFGLSLGNEGIHGAKDQEAVFEQWRDNMLTLISKARADDKVPVVMNNYTRADYNDSDYTYIRRINMLIHQWDVTSVNTLGAIDDGAGHWAKGYENDPFHPNDAGHYEFMTTIPPSLFDALLEGKPLPQRDRTGSVTLSGSEVLSFRGEGTVHPFAVSFTVNGSQTGRLFTLHSGKREARVGINKKHRLYYVTLGGDSIVCPTKLNNDWHTVTLSHYYAAARTLIDVDGDTKECKERILAGQMTLGDERGNNGKGRQYCELMFWRSALNPDEIAAIREGKMLKSSLELYVPLSEQTKAAPVNKAQSLNCVRFRK